MKQVLLWFAHFAHRPALQRLMRRFAPVAGRAWFPPLAAIMAFAATLSMIIPTVPFLSAMVMLKPRRWRIISLWAILGSASAGALLVHLLGHFGTVFLATKLPELMASSHWQHMVNLTSHHGWWVLVLIAASPISQTPFLALAAILGMPTLTVLASLFAGKGVKYSFVAWLTALGAKELVGDYKQHY